MLRPFTVIVTFSQSLQGKISRKHYVCNAEKVSMSRCQPKVTSTAPLQIPASDCGFMKEIKGLITGVYCKWCQMTDLLLLSFIFMTVIKQS